MCANAADKAPARAGGARRALVGGTMAILCALGPGCRLGQPARARIEVRGGPTLAPVFAELAAAYSAQPGAAEVACNFTCPPCVLLQQRSGQADFDVVAVVGADTVQAYEQRGLVRRGTARQFGSSRLVLVTSQRHPAPVRRVEDLRNPKIKPIALADELVGPGNAAKQALEKLGLWAAVKPRVTMEQTGCSTMKLVSLGSAPVAIVCEFCLHGASGDVQLVAPFPATAAPPVALEAAVMAASQQGEEAQKFIEFLLSDEARQIISTHGINTPP